MEFNQDLVSEFAVEAKEHLAVLEEELLLLEKTSGSPSPDRIDRLFRAIHSIKGAAGFLGLKNIGSLSHVMETILQLIREGEVKPEPHFIDGLLKGTDQLGSMFDNVSNSDEMNIQEIYDLIVDLLTRATSPNTNLQMAHRLRVIDTDGNPVGFEIDEFTLNSRPACHNLLCVMKYDLYKIQRGEGLSPSMLVRRLIAAGQILDNRLETRAEHLSEDLSSQPLWYEVLYSTEFTIEDISEVTGLPMEQIITVTIDDQAEKGSREGAHGATRESCRTTSSSMEGCSIGADDTRSTAATMSKTAQEEEGSSDDKTPGGSAKGRDSVETVRIHVGILDQLMTLAGELVLVRNQQMLSLDRSDPVSRGISQRLDIVTSELQETIMRTRMQPAGNVFGKLPRIVRDLSKKLNKSIDITTYGDEVELDKTILESLADPLTHIVRNCCDHGIESESVRKAAGKSPTGQITVRAYHEGGQINIEVHDDGGGLDPDAIRRKALQNGLKTEAELAAMRDKDLYQLIMLPGFSTAKETTDVSGRGVGMDVVKTAIDQLGGSLELESTRGEGMLISLRLPLTLAIIPCLVVVVGDYRYAIPQVNLEELVCLYDDDVRTKIEYAGNQEVCRLRDRLLPMTRLNEVLAHSELFKSQTRNDIAEAYRQQMETSGKRANHGVNHGGNHGTNHDQSGMKQAEKSLTFAVVKVGSQRFGLIVDRVVGTEEIVVKPMHPAMKSLQIYSGATVMGDGKVALILDIEGIVRHAGVQFNVNQNVVEDSMESHIAKDTQAVLLFKNGTSEQFAISLPLIKRVERIAAEKIERIGEKEYVTIDGVSTLILRLDHVLKVSPCVEKDEISLLLPKHISRPFGILMSDVVDIVETTTDLGMTAYHEDGVLGTAIVRDRMTLFLDIYRLIERAEPDWFASRRISSPAPDRSCHILVAEDVPFFQQLVKGYLESEDYDVTVVADGQQAFDMLSQRHFDLLVSDIEMPVMDGYELIRRVRAESKFKGLPAIALTALDSPDDQARAFKMGYDKYQIKINRESLLTVVSDTLREHGVCETNSVTSSMRQKVDHDTMTAKMSGLINTITSV